MRLSLNIQISSHSREMEIVSSHHQNISTAEILFYFSKLLGFFSGVQHYNSLSVYTIM